MWGPSDTKRMFSMFAMLDDVDEAERKKGVEMLRKLDPETLRHVASFFVMVFSSPHTSDRRVWALRMMDHLEPRTLAPHAYTVVWELEDSDANVRAEALEMLGKLEPATLAQHADVVATMLEDSAWSVLTSALQTLGQLAPTALAQYAEAVVLKLEDSVEEVRVAALNALEELEPATLAQYADTVALNLEASLAYVRVEALLTLGKLEPATLAEYAEAVVLKLEDSDADVRSRALVVLRKMGPAAFAEHAHAVLDRLEDTEMNDNEFGFSLSWLGAVFNDERVRDVAMRTLRALPSSITRDVDFEAPNLRSRLLGRAVWYRCRRIFRVRRIAFYWYALPYRPSGPGHARDVEAWETMNKRIRHV